MQVIPVATHTIGGPSLAAFAMAALMVFIGLAVVPGFVSFPSGDT
jgi:Na+/citrate or Na+/malate symporter